MDDDDCQFVVTEPVAAIVNQRVRQHHPHGFGLASQVIGELTRLGLEVDIASAPGHGTAVTIAGPCAKEGPN